MKFTIQKKIDNKWVDDLELGQFDNIIEAYEKIFISIENKSNFWNNYRLKLNE
jgi:hypothetical protein